MITYARNTQKLDAHSILVNVMKCPAKSERINHLFVTLMLAFVFGLFLS